MLSAPICLPGYHHLLQIVTFRKSCKKARSVPIACPPRLFPLPFLMIHLAEIALIFASAHAIANSLFSIRDTDHRVVCKWPLALLKMGVRFPHASSSSSFQRGGQLFSVLLRRSAIAYFQFISTRIFIIFSTFMTDLSYQTQLIMRASFVLRAYCARQRPSGLRMQPQVGYYGDPCHHMTSLVHRDQEA